MSALSIRFAMSEEGKDFMVHSREVSQLGISIQ